MTIEGLRLNGKKYLMRKLAKTRQGQIENTHFTIISNNCWGGMVYESIDVAKQSPTVGLFFMADEYIRFLQMFPKILDEKIDFINPTESRYVDYLKKDNRFGTYPIGKVGDVEIEFMHYHSEEEVVSKWERRCERIVPERMLFKMNDQNLCTEKHLKCFDKLPFENKVIFSSKNIDGIEHLVYIRSARKQEFVYASQEPVIFKKYFDVISCINSL